MTCALTRARSEPKVRCETGLLTIVCLSHTEDVANRATRGIANYHEPARKQTEAENSAFTIVFALVFDFNRHAFEDYLGVFEVQATFRKCSVALGWVVGDSHLVIVSTKTMGCNGAWLPFQGKLVKPNV